MIELKQDMSFWTTADASRESMPILLHAVFEPMHHTNAAWGFPVSKAGTLENSWNVNRISAHKSMGSKLCTRKNGRVLSIVPKKYKNQWVNSLEFWPMPTKADSLLKPVLHLTSQKNQSANCSSRRVWKHQEVVWLSVCKSYQTNKRAIQLIVTGWSEWLVQLWLWPRNKHITLSQLLTQLAQGVWVTDHTWSNCKWPQTTIGQSFLVRLWAHPLCSRSRGAENLAKWDPSEAHHYLARSIREAWVC